MTDPADRHLEDRLHSLAGGVHVPVVPAGDDVRRGRRRLLRVRLAMAGATTGTLAVVLGITSLTAGEPSAFEPPVADTPSTSLPTDPTTSRSEEEQSTEDEKDGAPAKGDGGQQPPATDPTGTVGTDADTDRVPGVAGTGHGASVDSDPTGGATTGLEHDPTADPTATEPTAGPTSSTPSSTPTPTASSDPTTDPTADPTSDPTSDPTVPPTETAKVRVHQVLRYYNDVLAEHLDQARDHLQAYDRQSGNKKTTRSGGKLFALGSTYRWEDGQALGGLAVTVASGWDQLEWACGASDSDWDCHRPAVSAALAEVATHDGVLQVAVEHAQGQVVVLTADPTYDAGARAVSGFQATESELLAAAADDRLKLPGQAPVSPPRIDAETFATAGVTALVGEEESFTRTSIDRTPEVRGAWSVDDAARGTLSWSARPVYSGAGWQCLKAYRSCTDLVIDSSGRVVHVAAIKKRLGGGWVIEYDGGSYAVRVTATDQKFPRKRAYAFVTDEAWQPVR